MSLAEIIEEILNNIDLGPFGWADLDYILMQNLDLDGFKLGEIKAELDKQATKHTILIQITEDVQQEITVWATREVSDEEIIKYYEETIS